MKLKLSGTAARPATQTGGADRTCSSRRSSRSSERDCYWPRATRPRAADWALPAAAELRDRGLGHLAISRWHEVAVPSLVALGRTDEAAAIATEALNDAQSLGKPTPLTIALRLCALATTDRARQIELLERAASHLDAVASPVEQARTLLELGAALRRDKRRVDSREPLRQALDLAIRVNAAPLAARAREELRAAGARPRRVMLSGIESLTASDCARPSSPPKASPTPKSRSGCTSRDRPSRPTCPGRS